MLESISLGNEPAALQNLRVLRPWTHRTSAAALEAQRAAFVSAALPKSTQKQNVSMEGLKMKSEETSLLKPRWPSNDEGCLLFFQAFPKHNALMPRAPCHPPVKHCLSASRPPIKGFPSLLLVSAIRARVRSLSKHRPCKFSVPRSLCPRYTHCYTREDTHTVTH